MYLDLMLNVTGKAPAMGDADNMLIGIGRKIGFIRFHKAPHVEVVEHCVTHLTMQTINEALGRNSVGCFSLQPPTYTIWEGPSRRTRSMGIFVNFLNDLLRYTGHQFNNAAPSPAHYP